MPARRGRPLLFLSRSPLYLWPFPSLLGLISPWRRFSVSMLRPLPLLLLVLLLCHCKHPIPFPDDIAARADKEGIPNPSELDREIGSENAEFQTLTAPVAGKGLSLNADEPTHWLPMPLEYADEQIPGRAAPGSNAGHPVAADAEGAEAGDGPVDRRVGAEPRRDGGGAADAGEIDASGGESSEGQDSDSAPTTDWPIPARVAWSWKAFFDGELEPAMAEFTEVIELAPYRGDAYFGLGRCHLERSELDLAAESFDNSLRLEPDRPEVHFYRGLVAYQQEEFLEAVDLWESARPTVMAAPPGPLRRDFGWLLARAYLELGAHEQGEEAFAMALEAGGEGRHGKLYPPDLMLERLSDGRLPGARFQPVGGAGKVDLGGGLVFVADGAIWMLTGQSRLRVRLTDPPPGWRDGFPSVDPAGERLAFVSSHRKGRNRLVIQARDGLRKVLLDREIEAVRPAWSRDGETIAVVAMSGNPAVPRVHLVSLASEEIEVIQWPEGASTDPFFAPDGALLLSAEVGDRMHIARSRIGEPTGEYLRPLRQISTKSSTVVAGAKLTEKEWLNSRMRQTRKKKKLPAPMYVPDPWKESGEDRSALRSELVEEVDRVPREASRVESGTQTEEDLQTKPKEGESQGDSTSSLEAEQTEENLQAMPKERKSQGGSTSSLEAEQTEENLQATPKEGESQGGSTNSLWTIHPTGQIDAGDARQPAVFSYKEGRMIALTRAWSGLRRVWLRERGATVEKVASPQGLDCWDPAFSPEGRRLVFVCAEDGVIRPYVFDRLRERSEPLYEGNLLVRSPTWLPTGAAIANWSWGASSTLVERRE